MTIVHHSTPVPGGYVRHTGSRDDCTMPECTPAAAHMKMASEVIDELLTASGFHAPLTGEEWQRQRVLDQQETAATPTEGFTPDDAGKAAKRLHRARQQRNEARAEADRLREQLAGAEAIATTNRTEAEGRRHALAKALGMLHPDDAQWDNITRHAADAQKWATDAACGRNPATLRAKDRATAAEAKLAEAQRRAEQAEADRDRHQVTMSEVFGLGSGAPWSVIIDRACETLARAAAAEEQLAAVRSWRPWLMGFDPAYPDLAPLTIAVSPRELTNCAKDHPIYALREAIQGPGLPHYKATDLIKAYYDAITSAPPASPDEQPIEVVVRGTLTPEQIRAALAQTITNDGSADRIAARILREAGKL